MAHNDWRWSRPLLLVRRSEAPGHEVAAGPSAEAAGTATCRARRVGGHPVIGVLHAPVGRAASPESVAVAVEAGYCSPRPYLISHCSKSGSAGA